MEKTFTISEPTKRIDLAAAAAFPEYSRSKLQTFEVRLNDKPAKWSTPAPAGSVITIKVPFAGEGVAANAAGVVVNKKFPSKVEGCPQGGVVGASQQLNILFEDPHLIVAQKPRGIATHPGAGNEENTFVQMLLSHTPLAPSGGALRPGIVHRLDKDTSGILVAAKTDEAFRALSDMFQTHDLTRRYTAFVWGVPNWETAEITGNIKRSRSNRQKMTMVKIGGKPAQTTAAVKQVYTRAGISEIVCTLGTGRTHQIRVHLSTHGFPLVGDKTYGHTTHRIDSIKKFPFVCSKVPFAGEGVDAEGRRGSGKNSSECGGLYEFLKTWTGGQMLHADTLEFTHPITGESLKFHTPLPEEMSTLKELLITYQSRK
ncbi:MAG: RluA family pseudouridine synthase [Rickettsiales bacterium]|jgi:23S rRNA pseudouridine1911/1915/1917 synthase|nr:RluA family pseudouridine synthase [Rickettsiales bacterium]